MSEHCVNGLLTHYTSTLSLPGTITGVSQAAESVRRAVCVRADTRRRPATRAIRRGLGAAQLTVSDCPTMLRQHFLSNRVLWRSALAASFRSPS